ncbi:MAG: CcmD family protein [candidate division NC10 bacterium]|nr:CcmD family protein [candidate division NC10 bacterium]
MENLGYLFAAYSLVWVLLFGYLYRLSGKARELRRELDSLREAGER